MDGVRTTSEYDPKMIEAMARHFARSLMSPLLSGAAAIRYADEHWESFADHARIFLSALPLTPEALNAIWRGEAVVVPKQQTREMLDARQMVHGFAPLTNKRWKDIESARVGIAWNDASIVDEAWSAVLAASPYTKKE